MRVVNIGGQSGAARLRCCVLDASLPLCCVSWGRARVADRAVMGGGAPSRVSSFHSLDSPLLLLLSLPRFTASPAPSHLLLSIPADPRRWKPVGRVNEE